MESDERYRRAKRRVSVLKGFYIHLATYIGVMAMLLLIDFLTGGGWWFYWPLLCIFLYHKRLLQASFLKTCYTCNMNKLNTSNTITLKKDKVVAHHISDGSELIPAEIQANTQEEINQCLNKSLEGGYVIDDEGIINNYAIEADMYMANYPSPEQQKRYVFLGAGAMLLITVTLLISFAVS